MSSSVVQLKQQANELATAKQLTIPATNAAEIVVVLTGLTPLIMHRFGKKVEFEIAQKQGKAAKKAKEARDPHAEYIDSIYVDEDGDPCLPVRNIKAACLRAHSLCGMKNTNPVRFGMILPGETVKVAGDHHMRTDPVRLSNGVSSLAYRAEFTKWEVQLKVRLNLNIISIDQAINVLVEAGQACGVGDWRNEKSSGTFGMWSVTNVFQTAGEAPKAVVSQ